MTPVPLEWQKGIATPSERSALVSALTVALGAMRDAGMIGPVVSIVDGELSDAFNSVLIRPPATLRPLADEAAQALK